MNASILRHVDNDILSNLLNVDALYLATENPEGIAEASYAPFVESEQMLFVYISELATHTNNILQQRYAGALLIEDSQHAKNAFARKRLSLHCSIEVIARDSDIFSQVTEKLSNKYGNTMSLLKTMSDFHLIKLTATKATLVEGFGKTSHIDEAGMHPWTKNYP